MDLMNHLVYEDINFEMCCIMFNIGAAHAQIGANETRTEMDVNFATILFKKISLFHRASKQHSCTSNGLPGHCNIYAIKWVRRVTAAVILRHPT